MQGEKDNRNHNITQLHELVVFWGSLDIRFLYPNDAVATTCYLLHTSGEYKDSRMSPTDAVHLGYALAYDADYLVTTDKNLQNYSVPSEFKLKIIPLDEARRTLP